MSYQILQKFPIINFESLLRIINDTNHSQDVDIADKLIDYLLQPDG